jgi:hypothetical protein
MEVNAEETKYLPMSRHQIVAQNHNVKIANKFLENIAKFRNKLRAD